MMSGDPAPQDNQLSNAVRDDNPYKPTTAAAAEGHATSVDASRDRTPFAFQAVRFSLYAPVLLSAANLIVRESLGVNHPGTKGFAILCLIAIVAAFSLGIVGMVGSLKRAAFWSAFLGLFGMLLNGMILAAAARLWT